MKNNKPDNILYSTGCAACHVVESALIRAGIPYTLCTDEGVMTAKGFQSVPVFFHAESSQYLLPHETVKLANAYKERQG